MITTFYLSKHSTPLAFPNSKGVSFEDAINNAQRVLNAMCDTMPTYVHKDDYALIKGAKIEYKVNRNGLVSTTKLKNTK